MLDSLRNFHPLRDRRRRAILAEPISDEARGWIEANVAHYALLTDSEKRQLGDDARVFVAEKEWEGGNGFSLTAEMKLTIAAQACLLLLGWSGEKRAELFPNVHAIIVYPAGYHTLGRTRQGLIETEAETGRLGEAWSADLPVILSWRSAQDGGEDFDDGHNVVLHEFAHKLDQRDGRADGVPVLADSAAYDSWAEALSVEFAALRHAATAGHHTFLNPYGATNEAEFFAVATEAFFEKSLEMREHHPRLYAALQSFYNQDPAARFERHGYALFRMVPIPQISLE